MALLSSGIYSVPEFKARNVLKLAPDCFVVVNGALGSKVVAPLQESKIQDLEVRGGITSVNVNMNLFPAGSSTASIDIIAPQYKGLHEDYYVTVPSGVRIPFFLPMMEVKIYMKGRYLSGQDEGNPGAKYYPVFWGFINNVTENYSGGVSTISLSCHDMLKWWGYQKITLVPTAFAHIYGGPSLRKFPTVFKNMNPWQIIYTLFSETGMADYNFVYPKVSTSLGLPDLNGLPPETVGALAKDTVKYWRKRFGFNFNGAGQGEQIPLEFYGFRGKVNTSQVAKLAESFDQNSRNQNLSDFRHDLDLDFNLLAKVQPFGGFDLYDGGSQSLEHTKLEIANMICEQTHMEFFSDTNGFFVFKPPFYNLDVRSNTAPYYTLENKDIINFNSSLEIDNLVTYLEVTAPKKYELTNLELVGFHIDYDLLNRFGMRYQRVAMRYGNNAKTLRMIAAAEMSRINGRAFTGSASIPLRPELRLGYPVYVDHIDAFYYVTGISHSFSYGSTATTSLSFETRRDRVYDEGSITGVPGATLRKYVYRFSDFKNGKATGTNKVVVEDSPVEERDKENLESLENFSKDPRFKNQIPPESEKIILEDIKKEAYLRNNGMLSGPKTTGFYEVSPAQVTKASSNIANSGQRGAYVDNELVMVTDNTVPYTDINGYRHIGVFPYGANLKLSRGTMDIIDIFDPKQVRNNNVKVSVQATPEKTISEDTTTVSDKTTSNIRDGTKTREETIKETEATNNFYRNSTSDQDTVKKEQEIINKNNLNQGQNAAASNAGTADTMIFATATPNSTDVDIGSPVNNAPNSSERAARKVDPSYIFEGEN